MSECRTVPRYTSKCNFIHTIRDVRPCVRRFAVNSQLLNSFTCRSFVPNWLLNNRALNAESTDRNQFTPLINTFLWTCSVTNFFKSGRKVGRNSIYAANKSAGGRPSLNTSVQQQPTVKNSFTDRSKQNDKLFTTQHLQLNFNLYCMFRPYFRQSSGTTFQTTWARENCTDNRQVTSNMRSHWYRPSAIPALNKPKLCKIIVTNT